MRRANPDLLQPYASHRGGETARACGITYRQLDHWSTVGYLRPIFLGGENHDIPAGPGSGHWRDWPAEELRGAREMGRLTAAGLIPEVAHRVARSYRTGRVLHALGSTPALLTHL
jgi:hypothetical protein